MFGFGEVFPFLSSADRFCSVKCDKALGLCFQSLTLHGSFLEELAEPLDINDLVVLFLMAW